MRRLTYFLVFMVLGGGLLYLLVAREPPQGLLSGGDDRPASDQMQMQSVRVLQVVGERLVWEIDAERAAYDDVRRSARFENVRFVIHPALPGADGSSAPDALQGQAVVGQARSATLSAEPAHVALEGDVVLTHGVQTEIRTRHLIYREAEGVLESPGPVEVHAQGMLHKGASLRYNLLEQRFSFTAPIFAR